MADFEEASVSAFRRVYRDVTVTGWFYFVQSIIKRVHKLHHFSSLYVFKRFVFSVDLSEFVTC